MYYLFFLLPPHLLLALPLRIDGGAVVDGEQEGVQRLAQLPGAARIGAGGAHAGTALRVGGSGQAGSHSSCLEAKHNTYTQRFEEIPLSLQGFPVCCINFFRLLP